MKRLTLILILMIVPICMFSQSSRIVMNDQDPVSGLHCLATSEIIVRNGMTDRHPLKVSILAIESSDGWRYLLNIAVSDLVSRAIPEGGVLLVRTQSGEVIELINRLDEVASTDWVGDWIEGTANKIYYNKASYEVTREQLEAMSVGVQKIRMQISGGPFDTVYKKDRMGGAIAAHLAVIDGASAIDLRSGF